MITSLLVGAMLAVGQSPSSASLPVGPPPVPFPAQMSAPPAPPAIAAPAPPGPDGCLVTTGAVLVAPPPAPPPSGGAVRPPTQVPGGDAVRPPTLPENGKEPVRLVNPPSTNQPGCEACPAGNGQANGACSCQGEKKEQDGCFFRRLAKAYCDAFDPNPKPEEPPAPRRALPAPFASPPFPTGEWQGFPLIGVPPSSNVYPLMAAIYGGPGGDAIKDSRIKAYGWVNGSVNASTSHASNTPSSYWIDPNNAMLNQLVFRLERELDTVQTDHVDWGFRATYDYGSDYRYFTAGGWFSDQLLVNNRLYGHDLTELYANVYIPGIAQGMILTLGRWIATPDIETQFAPDNYMGTHSLLFTIDVYTETGMMATVMLDKQWTVQAAIHAGADMAPWYEGAVPTGMAGIRWVSKDNNDSVYTVLNALNNAKFRYFDLRGQPAGHHNYNIIQSTWQHKFSDDIHTKTEAYYMWERDAAVGGTPSLGRFRFNSGGGLGPTVPGLSSTCALLNYTMFKVSPKDFFTVRNEYVYDQNGTRYGFAGNYTSHSLGLSHNFSSVLTVRPEVGYYRNYNNPAFDNGARKDMWLAGFDVILRF